MNKFFSLGSACLLNEPKTKAQTYLIYKQKNMNELFIEPSPSCSWSVCFIYIPYYYRYNDMEECLETDFHLKNSTIARDNAWAWSQEFIIHLHQHCHLVFFIKKEKDKKGMLALHYHVRIWIFKKTPSFIYINIKSNI